MIFLYLFGDVLHLLTLQNMYRYMYVSACQIQKHNKKNYPDDAFITVNIYLELYDYFFFS